MSWGEEQQKEIEDNQRERKITVKLSDADCDRLARKCGEAWSDNRRADRNFFGDLVGGTYPMEVMKEIMLTSGSSVVGSRMFPELTLLNHLLNLS